MAHDPDCIFCKIIDGDIPSFKVFEDEKTLTFMDISPVNPGHVLVIPKYHAPDLMQIPTDWLMATVATAQTVAQAVDKALKPDGINILQSNGPAAGQSVFHLHVHIIPRTAGDKLAFDWGIAPGDMDAIGAVAERIRASVV
ncbi:MAG: HIT family protein [Rhodospirillales bacterium]|jgi:histidine triad (HIT) family protein|nr:HIT family protein [Rhodospirillales bacterium]